MRERTSTRTKKALDYPDETEGSRLAAEIRRRCNKMTAEERRHHFEQAMALIYAGEQSPKATGAGHQPRS
jgi:hypothetical protein